jgi:hypothetical protein
MDECAESVLAASAGQADFADLLSVSHGWQVLRRCRTFLCAECVLDPSLSVDNDISSDRGQISDLVLEVGICNQFSAFDVFLPCHNRDRRTLEPL